MWSYTLLHDPKHFYTISNQTPYNLYYPIKDTKQFLLISINHYVEILLI